MTLTGIGLLFLLGAALGFLIGSSHAAKAQWDYLKRHGVVSDDPEWIERNLGRKWRR